MKTFISLNFIFFVLCFFNISAFGRIGTGNQLFHFDLAGRNEYFADGISRQTFSGDKIAVFNFSADYFQFLLSNAARNQKPILISVGIIGDNSSTGQSMNAYARSDYPSNAGGLTSLANAVINNDFRSPIPANMFYRDPSFATIAIGADFLSNSNASQPQILPQEKNTIGLSAVIIHELSHSLGILTNIALYGNRVEFKAIGSTNNLSAYDRFLVDSWGTPAGVGKNIILRPSSISTTTFNTSFIIINYGDIQLNNRQASGFAFFQGPKTMEVLGENYWHKINNPNLIKGLPILGAESANAVPELSHIELKNSLMSHQAWRNWSILMESEIALLQDLGFSIDRKNFYGFSLYSDENTIDISSNFYARNSAGDRYLDGVFNKTPLTIGIHIYGSSNTMTISGEILQSGFSAIGMRIDGINNKVIISSQSKIFSDGEFGSALLVSYGRGHAIVHRGEMSAKGDGASVIKFDFGHSIFGDNTSFLGGIRGSYMATDVNVGIIPIIDEINGALIEHFDISGGIKGGQTAIYISKNAYVKNINILKGAEIEGDIKSDWQTDNPLIQYISPQTLITNLTFGKKTDSQGQSLEEADNSFNMVYSGDIMGDSLNVIVYGGTLSFSGSMDIFKFMANSGSIFNVLPLRLKPVSIKGDNVIFNSNDINVFIDEDFFQYYSESGYEALSLNGNISGIDADRVSIIQNAKMAIGFYDYRGAVFSKKITQNSIGFRILSYGERYLNTDRLGGRQKSLPAISAPMLFALQEPIGNLIFDNTLLFNGFENDGNQKYKIGGEFSYNSTQSKDGFSIENFSFSLLPSKQINKSFLAGAALKIELPEFRADFLDNNAVLVLGGLYGVLQKPLLNVAFFAGASFLNYSQIRQGYENVKYNASYGGFQYEAGVQISKPIESLKNLNFIPFLDFELINLQTDKFDESGGEFALHYEKQNLSAEQLRIGANFIWMPHKKLTLISGIFYRGLFGDIGGAGRVFFKDSDMSESVDIEGIKTDGSFLSANLGLSYEINSLIKTSIKTSLSESKTQSQYGTKISLTFSF